MTKFLAICLILIGLTFQACDKGCLKCTTKNDCLFCDITNGYFLSNGNCALSAITNCLVLNSNGECGQCKENYFLDSSTKKCVAVPTANQIANCSLYGNGQVCIKCAKSFYISAGKCAAVVKVIDNCETYSGDGFCIGCSVGSIFNAARDGCVAKPDIGGCAAYSFVDCKTCASGFIQNLNLYFVGYQNSASSISADIQNFMSSGVANDWTALSRCQKIQDDNCLTALAFNVCSICKPKFFLAADKTCRANPFEIIEFCLTYSSLTTCTGCQSGYFLENSRKCTLVTGDKLIADCLSYDNKASSALCVLCSSTRFLSANTCSSVRVDSVNIANCKTVAVSADSCAVCNDGFILTTDGKKCLAAISNCTDYNPSLTALTSLICKTCAASYYLNTADSITTCVAGNIEGCLAYSSSTVCSSCNTIEYYLKDGKCTKHIKVDVCNKYSNSNFNECSTCQVGFVSFKYSFYCLPITLIANCSAYSDETTCTACYSGYYVLNNKCVNILQSFPNCLSATTDSPNCTECAGRYALKSLASDKTCAPNHNYILDFCYFAESDISFKVNNVADTDSCVICKDSTFPFDLSYLTVCISDTLLATRGVDSPVLGCRKYSSGAVPVCQQCPVYVGIDAAGLRTCQETCTSSTSTHLLDDLVGSVNTCTLMVGGFANYSLANCSTAVKAKIGADFALSCIKVISTQKPLVAVSDATVVADNPTIWKDLVSSTITRPTDAFLYNGIEITPSNSETSKHPTLDTNCELYWKRSDLKLYCARCKFGYTVRFKDLTIVPLWDDTDDYQTTCEPVDFCDTLIKYTGFKSTLNRFLSCHACTGTKVVTVVLGVILASDALTYNISSFIHDKPVVACRETAAVATYDAPVLVANCLVYGWNFRNNTPATPVNPTVAKGCLTCKPGFAMTYAAGTDVFGSACTAIADCDNTKKSMANRCTACTQVDGLGAAAPKALADYNGLVCRLVKSANCLFSGAGPDANAKYECRVCNPGYWLNHDKVCEKLTLPQCADVSGSTTLYAFPASPNLIASWTAGTIEEYYALKFLARANSITGCDTCYSGFIGFRTVSGEKQCLASTYVVANVFLASPLKYITDCLRYNNDLNAAGNPVATCDVCKSGKIRTDDGKKCVAAISKCLFAQNDSNSTKCLTCEKTHVSVSGVCTLKSIALCATYNESISVTDLLCATCNSGYVLAANKKSCYIGKVTGCQIYDLDLPYACNTCLDGYSKVNTANSRTYCFKINTPSNCKILEGSTGGLQDGLFKCNTCNVSNSAAYIAKAYQTSDTTKVQSLCLSLNAVQNCIAYGTTASTVNLNSYLCTACLPNFWINEDTNLCVLRTNQPAGCLEYEINKDRCKKCNNSTFINENSTDCVSFPNGILRCATYSNDTICTSCQPPAYLNSNGCPLSIVIPKCLSYSANYTCTSCEPNYFLTNSTFCELAKAANCYTYTSINACEKCNPGETNKGLKTDTNGVISCVDKNVPNCDLSTNEFPFKCTQCKKGFYLGIDGNCAAAVVIQRCLVYDTVSTCTQCEPLSILAVDRKTCEDTKFVAFNDINCLDSQLLGTPLCSKCTPGSIFVNNACTACINNTYSSGCFTCDPANQANCLACRPGYSQNANGVCSALVSQRNNTNSTTSASIVRLLGLLVLLVGLMF